MTDQRHPVEFDARLSGRDPTPVRHCINGVRPVLSCASTGSGTPPATRRRSQSRKAEPRSVTIHLRCTRPSRTGLRRTGVEVTGVGGT